VFNLLRYAVRFAPGMKRTARYAVRFAPRVLGTRSPRPAPAPGTGIRAATLAGASLIAGYGVVALTGSRPLGGFVLLLGAILCVRIWVRLLGLMGAVQLAGVLFVAFVLSHLIALVIGAWPAVLLVAAVSFAVTATRTQAQLQPVAPKRL
jgi:hypothetical protein